MSEIGLEAFEPFHGKRRRMEHLHALPKDAHPLLGRRPLPPNLMDEGVVAIGLTSRAVRIEFGAEPHVQPLQHGQKRAKAV